MFLFGSDFLGNSVLKWQAVNTILVAKTRITTFGWRDECYVVMLCFAGVIHNTWITYLYGQLYKTTCWFFRLMSQAFTLSRYSASPRLQRFDASVSSIPTGKVESSKRENDMHSNACMHIVCIKAYIHNTSDNKNY